jgi:crossover junction endodeoxyribonuclease RuvC
MRVLGIDPGLATMGYGVVERSKGKLVPLALGAIRTPSTDARADRLAAIRLDLLGIIDEFRPQAVAMERLFFNINVKTAMVVGQASGVALATCAERGLGVVEYTPGEVKGSVVGFGGATKRQVQAMVGSLLGLDEAPKVPDAADACALAICHLNRGGLREALAGGGR